MRVLPPCVFMTFFLIMLHMLLPSLSFRNDDQKYKQSGKTTSRKAQKRSEGKGKGHKG